MDLSASNSSERTAMAKAENVVRDAASWFRENGNLVFAKMMDDAIEEISALRAAADGVNVGVGWQPIETASKDGKPFLAVHEASGVRQITSYGKTSHVPLYGWTVCPDGDPEEIDLWHPTHWMPLPEPPSSVGVDVGVSASAPEQTADTSSG